MRHNHMNAYNYVIMMSKKNILAKYWLKLKLRKAAQLVCISIPIATLFLYFDLFEMADTHTKNLCTEIIQSHFGPLASVASLE